MSNNNILNDNRFAGVARDPKFKKLRWQDRKIKIDKRFQSMFKNDAFKVKYTVDKRGRQISRSTSEDFKKFYDLSSNEESGSGTSEDEISDNERIPEDIKGSDEEILPLVEDDLNKTKPITSGVRAKLKDMSVDYARGEGKLFSESSSDESDSEESESENVYHEWNELDKDAETVQSISNRLAVCNMDWDRIRAVDLMMLFNSFLPPKGFVHSVVIYPSDFGLKRLAEEELHGPAELVNSNRTDSSDDDSDEEAEEGKNFHMERMRQYQLNRLKYYYAVVTFNTPDTADYIYTNCNGVEYESSGIRLDLRFIDDDVMFDQEPKDVCDDVENCRKYKPRFFTNTALQQAKVDLTWDETDPRRLEFTQKISEAAKTDDINDSDLEDFVALSSSGEEEDEENEAIFNDSTSEDNSGNESDISEEKTDPIEKYRNLLKEIEENEKEENENEDELEITWGADCAKPPEKTKISEKTTHDDEDEKTPFERLIQRRKEISKIKRETKMQKHSEVLDNEEIENHENESGNKKMKKKKKKKKKSKEQISDDEDTLQVNVNDERFSALYSSHLFNIDPTNSKFRKTKGMNAFVLEKQKRIAQKETKPTDIDDEPERKKKKDTELSFLVKSLKNKSKYLLPNKLNKRR